MNLKSNINLSQDISSWDDWWKGLNPKKEIQKWDYYGLRPWILKYSPRHEKVLEAGCGLGRWVFYLSRLGINIEGLDFSEKSVSYLQEWKKKNNLDVHFSVGDVCKLPYKDNSLSGYISLGVVEHFIDGPEEPLQEAYRVLRPGGIAIVTTPSISWYLYYRKFRKKIINLVKSFLGRDVISPPFFQYEYRPSILKKYVQKVGFHVSRSSGADLMYTFSELGGFKGENIRKGSFGYYISHKFEDTIFKNYGAQSIAISVKTANEMHCFLCGELAAILSSLEKYDVPICTKCENDDSNSIYYKKNVRVGYHRKYIINPEILIESEVDCMICTKDFITDDIFENFGFYKNICVNCLKDKSNSIYVSNNFIQPIWRDRNQI